jgi:hypothetical protein
MNKKIVKPNFIITLHHVLPNSQKSIDAHSPSNDAMFVVLYNEFDISTDRFHTFSNFGNYHKFSFPLNGGTMPPLDTRIQVN